MIAARALLLLAAACPLPALAQAYQCRLPQRIEPAPPVTPDGPARRTPIAGYTLAASWSPEYCRRPADKASMQCSGRNGRFGFILHGLWPNAAKGPPPQWCAIGPRPAPETLRRNLCMTPAPGLLAHEWAKHGSCMSKTPDAYFNASAILWRSLDWPDVDRLSRKNGLTAGDLREAFVAANPAWRQDQVGLLVSRSGWLREIQVCYGRDFLPARCDRRTYGPANRTALKIWRGL